MKKRILIVDDEEAVRKSFALALKKQPYEMDVAENGKVALQKLDARPYDLVYLDLKMPVMNGVETLIEIRKRNAEVPVYIVTAFHREFFDELTEAREKQMEFELLRKTGGARSDHQCDAVHSGRRGIRGRSAA